MPYLSIFGLEFEKKLIFKISTLIVIMNQFLINIVNFWHTARSSKGPGSTSSEGSGLGQLCKVCQNRQLSFS